jgi:hypothetical protein
MSRASLAAGAWTVSLDTDLTQQVKHAAFLTTFFPVSIEIPRRGL